MCERPDDEERFLLWWCFEFVILGSFRRRKCVDRLPDHVSPETSKLPHVDLGRAANVGAIASVMFLDNSLRQKPPVFVEQLAGHLYQDRVTCAAAVNRILAQNFFNLSVCADR